MAGHPVGSPRRIAAIAGGTVLLVGTLAGLLGWRAFLGVYAAMFLLVPLAAFTAWGVMKLWETGSRVATDGARIDADREDEDGRPDPLTVLRRRYAAGELDLVEFEARVESLVRTADAERHGFEPSANAAFAETTGGERVSGTARPTVDD